MAAAAAGPRRAVPPAGPGRTARARGRNDARAHYGDRVDAPALPGDLVVYRVPLVTRFRGIVEREGVLWRGPAGWAEFCPFWDYDAPASAPWLRAAREAADVAWPAPVRTSISVNVTVPAVGPDAAHAIVAGSGCRTAKVKVAEPGQSAADDVARVEAVRDALGTAGRIRVDANAAWDADEAVAALRRLDRAAGGLEYAEQPCRAVADLARVRRAVDVPIAADEAVRLAADPLAVVRAEACDVVVLKVAPLGGVRAALALAEQVGVPVVVSSALETSVGLAAGIALAAALPELPYACGLGTARLLAADVCRDSLTPVDGAIAVRRPEPDAALLAAATADPGTTERWRHRLAQVAEAT